MYIDEFKVKKKTEQSGNAQVLLSYLGNFTSNAYLNYLDKNSSVFLAPKKPLEQVHWDFCLKNVFFDINVLYIVLTVIQL